MGRKAITLDQQINLLRSRGMIINDVEKAKEVLLDVGYYRLGFYWFPFEQTYPQTANRTHHFKPDCEFDTAIKLYYFDFKLRSILSYYLNRIEINLRNFITYTVSNQYDNCPTWFANNLFVSQKFADSFQTAIYDDLLKKNLVLRRHHAKYPQDDFAPAWKTLEFMTLGGIVNLYKSLLDEQLRRTISRHFGVRYTDVFDNYLELVRNVRNHCAHGNVLFDFTPNRSIRRGPAGTFRREEYNNLSGAIKVILFLLSSVSVNRANDMKAELTVLIQRYANYSQVKQIIKEISGLEDFLAPIS